MPEPSIDTLRILAGGAIGAVLGWLLQRSHFCTMGCLADFFLFGSRRRLREWAIALATAMLGTQLLAGAGAIDLGLTLYAGPGLAWGGTLLGGTLFGFGMVLTGGCTSRNLVRLAGGSLKALVTLLVMAGAALATRDGFLAPLERTLRTHATLPLAEASLPALLPDPAETLAGPLLVAALIAVLLWFALRDAAGRPERRGILTGIGIGALVPLAWLATLTTRSSPSATQDGLTLVMPTADLLAAGLGGAIERPFGIALVLGTLVGAFLAARLAGPLRLETFSTGQDLRRHLVGGTLMGVGGALAQGCTIGHGLTGLAALGAGSVLAVLGIVAGTSAALRWLQR